MKRTTEFYETYGESREGGYKGIYGLGKFIGHILPSLRNPFKCFYLIILRASYMEKIEENMRKHIISTLLHVCNLITGKAMGWIKYYCNACCENRIGDPLVAEVYDHPWKDTKARTLYFCNEDEEQSYMHGGDFSYFYCEGCDREICEQNPNNGWMSQYRIIDEDTMICLQCYEDQILENGQPRSNFEGTQIGGGMFAPGGDEHGYVKVPGFSNHFISGKENIKAYNTKALELIDAGGKVVTDYERLAIGGGEGYITMWVKMPGVKTLEEFKATVDKLMKLKIPEEAE